MSQLYFEMKMTVRQERRMHYMCNSREEAKQYIREQERRPGVVISRVEIRPDRNSGGKFRIKEFKPNARFYNAHFTINEPVAVDYWTVCGGDPRAWRKTYRSRKPKTDNRTLAEKLEFEPRFKAEQFEMTFARK